ncbi:hypothetical protein BpHYR1_041681 [Brachionus plicatilis]|uniref:Uncharacterized protein n=1 Tax=Brachionus plicatilis TaxID=10195 RepID=A0A3M7ST89_BRAPC|nr:hypothetical protein BpHYR1_041681 [Brachionus plicatilis]
MYYVDFLTCKNKYKTLSLPTMPKKSFNFYLYIKHHSVECFLFQVCIPLNHIRSVQLSGTSTKENAASSLDLKTKP